MAINKIAIAMKIAAITKEKILVAVQTAATIETTAEEETPAIVARALMVFKKRIIIVLEKKLQLW